MYDIYEKLLENFQEQDYENGFFDVIFHVDGKELYAHRAVLSSASSVFEKQFLSSKSDELVNQPIPIFDYSYDEFYEFLYFIYVPNQDPDKDDVERCCDPVLDPKNVFVLAELAHAYEIDCIKKRCAQHLSYKMAFNVNEDVDALVLAHKYLYDCEYELDNFLNQYSDLKEYHDFVNLEKSVINAFVCFRKLNTENLCKEVYKWGEHQAMLDENMSKEEKKELVKFQLNDFLPLLFEKKNVKFLFEFAVEKGLISVEEANKYLTTQVTVKSRDKTIKGSFVDVYGILEFLQSYNRTGIDYRNNFLRYSNSSFKIPSTPSPVQKMKGGEWYLLFDENWKLCVKHRTLLKRNNYLIAEMKFLNTAKNVNGSSVDESFIFNQNTRVHVSRGE